jgi:CRISPR/Cas system-associated exonuclease Cas4 (RecB family)
MFSVFLKSHLLTKKFFTFLIGSTYLTCKVGHYNFIDHKELKNKKFNIPNKEFDSNLHEKSDASEIKKNEKNKNIPNYSLYSIDNFKFLVKNMYFSFSNLFYYLVLFSRSPIAYCDIPKNRKPYLGCSIRSNDEEPQGMKVVMIKSDSPAEKAGLKVKDIILEIDGKKIRSINEYNAAIGPDVGMKKLKIFRIEGDKEIILEIDVEFIYCD